MSCKNVVITQVVELSEVVVVFVILLGPDICNSATLELFLLTRVEVAVVLSTEAVVVIQLIVVEQVDAV